MYLDPLDPGSGVSIITMTRGKLNAAIVALPDDLLLLTEGELRKRIKPTRVDYCLRTSFWREYEQSIRVGRDYITALSVLTGICSDAYFYQHFLKDDIRVAWLVKPVQTYMKEIEAVLMRGTERLWELMEVELEVTDKDGNKKVDPRLAAVLLETIKMVEARAKGHAMLRSEARSVSVNVQAPAAALPRTDHRTLNARMIELSERMHGVAIVGTEEVLEPVESGEVPPGSEADQ
jgi:hypothetical protein